MAAVVEDHAIAEGEGSAPAGKGHRRTSSSVAGVYSPAELEAEGKVAQLSKEVAKLNWKINTSPTSLGEPDTLKKNLTAPPMNRVDLQFPLGLHVTARNRKGVTIKDALDAIYKQMKKRQDDELEDPYLEGLIYDPTDSDLGYGTMQVVLKKQGAPPSGKKKKASD